MSEHRKPAPWLDEATAPNGHPIRHNFRQWFGASVIVDAKGQPLKVYHGTHSKFTQFDPNIDSHWVGPDMNDVADIGTIYFSSNRKSARSYGRNVMPVYLSLQNPFVFDAQGKTYREVIPSAFMSKAFRGGHDGIVVRNIHDDTHYRELGDTYIAFRPDQIKSATHNSGNFDPGSPCISDLMPAPRPAPSANRAHSPEL